MDEYKDLAKRIEQFRRYLDKDYIGDYEDGANRIVEYAKSVVPVKTGMLRDSIHYEIPSNEAILFIADAQNPVDGFYYGNVVEYGGPKNQPTYFLFTSIEMFRDYLFNKIKKRMEDILSG